jgi:hypothetical protein
VIRLYRVWLVSAIIAALGTLLCAYALLLAGREVAFAVDGTHTMAVTTSKSLEGESTSYTYHLAYRFTPPGSSPVDGSDIIGGDLWSRLSVEDQVAIDYVRSDPGINRVSDNAPLVVMAVVLLAGVVFAVVGWWAFGIWYGDYRRRRRLAVIGVSTTGRVTEVGTPIILINGRASYRLRYEYLDSSGAKLKGRSGFISRADAMRWKDGTGIVRYDPAHPAVSAWFGDPEPVPREAVHDAAPEATQEPESTV